MTMINSESDCTFTYSGDYVELLQTLNNPQKGRQYLATALESHNEQTFLVALHNLMDAILWDIERCDRL